MKKRKNNLYLKWASNGTWVSILRRISKWPLSSSSKRSSKLLPLDDLLRLFSPGRSPSSCPSSPSQPKSMGMQGVTIIGQSAGASTGQAMRWTPYIPRYVQRLSEKKKTRVVQSTGAFRHNEVNESHLQLFKVMKRYSEPWSRNVRCFSFCLFFCGFFLLYRRQLSPPLTGVFYHEYKLIIYEVHGSGDSATLKWSRLVCLLLPWLSTH